MRFILRSASLRAPLKEPIPWAFLAFVAFLTILLPPCKIFPESCIWGNYVFVAASNTPDGSDQSRLTLSAIDACKSEKNRSPRGVAFLDATREGASGGRGDRSFQTGFGPGSDAVRPDYVEGGRDGGDGRPDFFNGGRNGGPEWTTACSWSLFLSLRMSDKVSSNAVSLLLANWSVSEKGIVAGGERWRFS